MKTRGAGLGAVLAIALAGPAVAQVGNIELELNTVADVDGVCRLTYVATNATPVALEKMSYEVAVFDTEVVFKRFFILEFGRMPSGKTRVVQFDLADQPCSGISRISVNDPVECTGAGGEQTICRDSQVLSSRIPTIQFN